MGSVPTPRARIRPLPEHLISQIAAGEVVERPASVVKELVENSLDAGAVRVEIEVENGGQLLRVRDDGSGIDVDDLELALCRHATSKLRDLEGLASIQSLGFRGEALPSIAAVSRLTLSSRSPAAPVAWSVRVEGGLRCAPPAPLAHPIGTTIEVRDLFFNTPARRKFLRSERTESLHVHELVRRLALGRFDVGFRLMRERREVLHQRPAHDQRGVDSRVGALLGARFMQHASALEGQAEDLRVSGFVTKAGDAGLESPVQYLYVNGRIVRDRITAHAVRRACQEIDLMVPVGFLIYIEIDPAAVDVNVHPTKQEVRFREARRVHDFVYSTVKRALAADRYGVVHRGGGTDQEALLDPRVACDRQQEAPGVYAYGARAAARSFASEKAEAQAPREAGAQPLGPVIGVLNGSFVLAEGAHGLVVVEVAAARRWLLAERFRQVLAGASCASQPLLIPEAVTLNPAEIETLLNCSEVLGRLGFEFDRAGPCALLIRCLPASLRGCDPQRLLQTLAARLRDTSADRGVEPPIEALAEVLAASAVGAMAAPIAAAEAEALVAALGAGGGAAGLRGVWRQVSYPELAKLLDTACGPPA